MHSPNQILIELTTQCNYHCSHCYADAGPGGKGEIPFEQLTTLLDQIFDMGIIWVGFTGGEPLLRKDILKILSYIKKYGESQIYTLLTNGTLLNPQFLEKFLQIQKELCINVQISLDGHNYETFSRQRGGTKQQFDTVIQNIRFLKEKGVNIITFFSVSDSTIGHALDTARFALFELGVDQFLLSTLFIAGRASQNYRLLEYQYEQWQNLLLEVTDIKNT
ncbi:MAG: Antilisterial bacteriocin subtilosin biosynthesis protein AlbA [Dehalococcoidia bacterium]|nr:Antilisterial bacteriocin subtilosin biosynthesis protein AlbA [Bacillota bacterium]